MVIDVRGLVAQVLRPVLALTWVIQLTYFDVA